MAPSRDPVTDTGTKHCAATVPAVTIYYVVPVNTQAPFGGVRVMYRHVDILNAHGMPASIVHGLAIMEPPGPMSP